MEKYKVDIIELKKIMVEQNLEKIIDLSAAAAVDRNTLSKVLNGDIKPLTTVIEKLMSALHIPPERAGKLNCIAKYFLCPWIGSATAIAIIAQSIWTFSHNSSINFL